MSSLVSTSAPSSEPITLAEAKNWLKVDSDVTEDDALISSLIEAARVHVETVTRRALIEQEFELAFDAFPGSSRWDGPRLRQVRGGPGLGREIIMPFPPLVSVESVKYYDTDGTLQTFSTAGYHVDSRSQPGRVVLHEDYDWPDTQSRPNAVIIAFTAGYGTPADVPPGLRTAMKQMLATWYGPARQTVNIGNIVNVIPHSAETLIWNFRISEAY